jgi:hypothetical protein
MKPDNHTSAVTLRLAWLFLSLCGIALGAILHHAAFRHVSVFPDTLRHKGSRFVFADLDGDRIPDLALVETERQRWANTDYAIRVRLSAGAESAIGVIGPSGGLRVAVRDVNGDSNLDLIVTAELDVGFIKVLLNDGHGNFSLVAPTDFLRKENEIHVAVRAPVVRPPEHGIVASVSTSRGDTDVPSLVCDRTVSFEPYIQLSVRRVVKRAMLSRSGRSPPGPVFFS